MVWKTVTTPSCSSPMSENFYECNLKPIGGYEAAYWTPNTMETDIKDYNDVTVHFDLPPEEYNLDIVTIYIFRHDSTSCNTRKSLIFFKDVRVGDADTYTLSVNQTGENRTMLDFTAHNISGGQYCAGIRPNPSRRQACKSGPGRSLVICTMTISPPFTILDDPCERKPCGEHGQCKSSGSGYSCDCSPGYIVDDGYCQENACFRNPCGQNGTCRTVIGRSNYKCTCSEGFEMYEGRCTADPCRSNSSAMCGQFGICVPSLELNNFNCQCHDGYDVIDGFCRVSVPSLTYIAIASIGGTLTGIALLVPFTLWMIRKRRKRRQDLPSGLSIQLAKNNAKYNEVTRPMIHVESDCVRPELLLLYSKDCSRHVDVVECFARFLEIRFGCKVHLDLWQTMEIAAAKTEWLFKKLKTVDKIVVVASRGTRERWDERCDGESFKKSSRVTDDFLTSALNIISSDFNLRERSERFGKYASVYFEYSDISDVP
ncbi:uncharacterized protein [Ptychodera flava]|uniref:uncharacterized protein n=1 Tax=Ptychodera flava TaxID=63121 RepID=UPI00396A3EE7